MKIFRAIGEKERSALIEKSDILLPHKTCIKEEWILNPHPEDYETGKFFFLTMEDALLYAKENYIVWNKKASILEMEIDEQFILPYLAYGIYCYLDYDKNGYFDYNTAHTIPELLLPYKLVENIIRNKQFRILEFKNDEYYNFGKYHPNKFNMPLEKQRPRSFVRMGNVLFWLKSSEEDIIYHKKGLEEWNSKDNKYDREGLKEAQKKYKKYKDIFPQTFEKFMECMRNYSWKDFRKDNSNDYSHSSNDSLERETERVL